MKDIFIIGSKGIPAKYGGFETFVEKLTEKKINEEINYHVACVGDDNKEFIFNKARCFNIKVPNIGSAKAIIYDIKALLSCRKYIKNNKLNDSVIYILACRIGPFLMFYKRRLAKLGIKVLVNPDGHEWKRSKWNRIVKSYWKYSERLMVKYSDLLICDSSEIEKYINETYKKYNPKTTYIAYGADLKIEDNDENIVNDKFKSWLEKNEVSGKGYYLIVGRFVSENNYELMIKEFLKTNTQRDLIIITNVVENKYYNNLLNKTKFNNDSRIKFVGTVYDQLLLRKIRQEAYGYIHGHEVGGTNPSLLEALASTKLNLLLKVPFNVEVGRNGAIYFTKESGDLSTLINDVDKYDQTQISMYKKLAERRILEDYTWEAIVNKYEKTFISN